MSYIELYNELTEKNDLRHKKYPQTVDIAHATANEPDKIVMGASCKVTFRLVISTKQ